jgi:hypothetical protein
MKNKERGKFILWLPRVLSIIFILFLVMFSLDVFGEGLNLEQVIVAFLLHNIPVFVLIIVLFFSWKHEIVGGVCFILAGILYILFNLVNIFRNGFEWYYLAWIAQISGFAFLVGILFIYNWIKRKNH